MQEEVDEKTIALCVRTSRMTAKVLKAALAKLLRKMEESRQRKTAIKAEQKTKEAPEVISRGKKSLQGLMDEGAELTNIEITDKNIRSFERVARKYSIDYSLKKDKSVDPPRYLVFFKAKDTDVMTAAFREYTGVSLKKSKKISVRKKLQKAIDRTANHRERQKTRQKDRGQER